jgi:hypothetical protein
METSSLPRRRRLRALAGRAGGVALLLTAVMAGLHLPFAAPLLRRLFPAMGCPIGRGTPEQIDRAHALGAAAIRAAAGSPAPARPALVFTLDETQRSELDAWARSSGVACAGIGGNANLRRCRDVPAAAVGQPDELGTLEEVAFEFRSSGQLVSVQTLRRRLTPAQAAVTVASLEKRTAAAVGSPTSSGGQPTARHLGRAFMATYVAVHTFSDYRATIAATNLAPTGVMVREEYLSARP